MRQYKFKNETMSSLVEEAREATNPILNHPYYGLKDKMGWMTRYPADQVMWERNEVISYLNGGASFDSCSVWGCDPTKEVPVKWSGKLHILGRLIVAYGRYDWLPGYPGSEAFSIHETIDLTSYFRLCGGYEIKKFLMSWGIETTCSLFTLSKKPMSWIWRKIQREVSLEVIISKLQSTTKKMRGYNDNPFTYSGYKGDNYDAINSVHYYIEMFTDPTYDNSAYSYARTCYLKYTERRSQRENCSESVVVKTKSERVADLVIKKHGHFHYRMSICGVKYKVDYESSYARDRDLYVVDNIIYYFKDNEFVKKIIAKRIGNLYAAKIQNSWFVWAPEMFSKHLETSAEEHNLSSTIKLFFELRKSSIEKSEVLRTGIITLRQFRHMTHSCWIGTMHFLQDNMPHIARLMSKYGDWNILLSSELADVKWHLSQGAMDSIRFRF